MKSFNQISQSAVYVEDETSVSITVCGGSYGGGSEVLVVEEDKDELFIPEDRRIQEVGTGQYSSK